MVQPRHELLSRVTDLQGRASKYRLTAQSQKYRGWNEPISRTVALMVRIRTVWASSDSTLGHTLGGLR
jgi:hypothetical protein